MAVGVRTWLTGRWTVIVSLAWNMSSNGQVEHFGRILSANRQDRFQARLDLLHGGIGQHADGS